VTRLRRTITPAAEGGVTVHLSVDERDVLATLPDQLSPLLTGDPSVPDLTQTLYSRGYADEELELEFRDLVGDDIVRQRVSALEAFAQTLTGGTVAGEQWRLDLDAEGAGAWLSALNDARLVLGALLGIDDEHEWDVRPRDDDPTAVLLDYLTELQEILVHALVVALPEE
jgi:hypothetical protein